MGVEGITLLPARPQAQNHRAGILFHVEDKRSNNCASSLFFIPTLCGLQQIFCRFIDERPN